MTKVLNALRAVESEAGHALNRRRLLSGVEGVFFSKVGQRG